MGARLARWHSFAVHEGAQPSLRSAAVWSVVWLLVGLGAGLVVWPLAGAEDAGLYVGVYVVERTLSLDNVFVFVAIFAYFGIEGGDRARLLTWAIVGALALRIGAILGGVALVERFDFLLYAFGALLVVLAWRMFVHREQEPDPSRSPAVRLARRLYPGATPAAMCLVAALVADLIFAVDSIPTAFAITRDPLLIILGNAFALLGLKSLFSLSEALSARLRYLDRTIAVLLGAIGVKLLLEDAVHIGPAASIGGIAAILAVGIVASLVAERRERSGAEAARAEV
jgi:tellurite resistance protein TerC